MIQQHQRAVLLAQQFFGDAAFTAIMLANHPFPSFPNYMK
jgi:hypothetical protein